MIPLLAALFVAPISVAFRAPATPSLRWSAPPECPDEAAIDERIVRLVGAPLPADATPVLGHITRLAEDGYVLELRVGVGEATETRTVTAASCDALADVAALLVAVVAEPVATAASVDVGSFAPVPESSTVAPSLPTDRTPKVRTGSQDPRDSSDLRDSSDPIDRAQHSASTARSSTIVSLRARLGPMLGATPGATAGGDLGLAVGGARVRGELVGAYWLPRRTGTAERSLRVSLATISPRVCGMLPQPRTSVVACVGPEIGIMRGDTTTSVRRPAWVAAVVEVGARISVGRRVSVWTTAGVAVALRFPIFRVRERGTAVELFRPTQPSGRLLVGVETRLGRLPAKSR